MYSKKQLKAAGKIILRIAKEHGIPESQVRSDLRRAMAIARTNPDPIVQARWATFRFVGKEPSVEEFILWCVSEAMDRCQ